MPVYQVRADGLSSRLSRRRGLQRGFIMFEKREELVALADEFDDIAVDADGKCYWCDVANAQTHLRAQLHRFAAQASAAPPEREAKLREPALTRTQFVIQMILCYARIYPEITTTGAMARAAETFRAFLNDEKIEFGDARYAWDSSGAANIVYGYEGVDLPKALSSRDDGEAESSDGVDLPLYCQCFDPLSQRLCQDKDRCQPMAEAQDAAISRIDVPGKTAGDSSADERDPYGNAEQWGMQYILRLFGKHIAGVESWAGGDGSESVDGDVLAEFDNIAKAAGWVNADGDTVFGPAKSAAQGGASASVEELADYIVDLGILMADDDCWDIARALLDKYSIRSAMMTEGE